MIVINRIARFSLSLIIQIAACFIQRWEKKALLHCQGRVMFSGSTNSLEGSREFEGPRWVSREFQSHSSDNHLSSDSRPPKKPSEKLKTPEKLSENLQSC
jgi:hypothetical protein